MTQELLAAAEIKSVISVISLVHFQCSWFVSLCFPQCRRTEESEDRSLQVSEVLSQPVAFM